MRILAALVVCVMTAEARQPVRARQAMVVAQEPLAAEVGLRVLKDGGNAVDAAVAVGFALAVTHPTAGNLGGGGFLLVRMADGTTTFFDFREQAPGAATRDMYLDGEGKMTRDSLVGWRASGVPGTVKGLETAHRKLGRKSWSDLLAPAVALARDGFPVSYSLATNLRNAGRSARNDGTPNWQLTTGGVLGRFAESKRVYLRDGNFYEPGETLKLPDLAATLSRIQKDGAKDFYEGETARILAREMAANGGLITIEDLQAYTVAERTPLKGSYKSYELLTAPPPSAGGLGMLQMLTMLDGSGYDKGGHNAAATIHHVAEVMKRSYADRGQWLGDPDFAKVPVRGLLSKEYLSKLKASISADRATPADELNAGDPLPFESQETTHFSIVDAEGNAVALTYTLNGGFGSGVTVPGLGFLMNNEMDDFAGKPGTPNMFGLVEGEANAIQPRKRPLSSMTPTIVLKEGKLFLVIGAPGGSRIPTGVMQSILNVVDFGLNIQDAVDAPRFHHQWKPDKLACERGISPDTLALLRKLGHTVDENTFGVARVEAIHVETTAEGKRWLAGGSDGRGDGKAVGY
ncbi:MAG: gamma-glutamyltransferase [Bryobacter sp.]|nr:gamma-glutamyltransferase [Bryobacter sp.]